MSSLALLALSFLLGIALRFSPRAPASAPQALNAFVLDIALPAVVLRSIHSLEIEWTLLWAAAGPWIVFAAAVAFFTLVRRWTRWSRGTLGALILVGGLGNTSFMGFPMLEAVRGPEALPVAVVVDQLGSFLMLSIPGLLVAAALSGDKADARTVVRRIVFFPPFIALVAAVLLRPFEIPLWLDGALERLGATLTPLALCSVGMQLRLGAIRAHAGPLAIGLLFKLALAPALIAALYLPILGRENLIAQVSVLEAAMGPMISAGILAQQSRLDPGLVTLLLGVGIPLSFGTVLLTATLLGPVLP
jgi:predicted permease